MRRNYSYAVEFVEASTPWAFVAVELASRNVHACPLEAIQRMCDDYERTLTVEGCLAAKAPWEK